MTCGNIFSSSHCVGLYGITIVLFVLLLPLVFAIVRFIWNTIQVMLIKWPKRPQGISFFTWVARKNTVRMLSYQGEAIAFTYGLPYEWSIKDTVVSYDIFTDTMKVGNDDYQVVRNSRQLNQILKMYVPR